MTLECNVNKYLRVEKPSDFKIEMPIQERLAIDLLKGMAKKIPLGLIDLTCLSYHLKN